MNLKRNFYDSWNNYKDYGRKVRDDQRDISWEELNLQNEIAYKEAEKKFGKLTKKDKEEFQDIEKKIDVLNESFKNEINVAKEKEETTSLCTFVTEELPSRLGAIHPDRFRNPFYYIPSEIASHIKDHPTIMQICVHYTSKALDPKPERIELIIEDAFSTGLGFRKMNMMGDEYFAIYFKCSERTEDELLEESELHPGEVDIDLDIEVDQNEVGIEPASSDEEQEESDDDIMAQNPDKTVMFDKEKVEDFLSTSIFTLVFFKPWKFADNIHRNEKKTTYDFKKYSHVGGTFYGFFFTMM